MLRPLDIVVIIVYLAAIAAFGIYMSGKQSNTKDYYLGDRKLPWWAVCLSVVATESSALTVISVPAIAYLGSFTFLQLAIGYFVGRILVAFVLLPRYYQGELTTAYTFLGQRFGGRDAEYDWGNFPRHPATRRWRQTVRNRNSN